MGWRNVKCLAGHEHKVYVQEMENSCGPSCLMMAYHRLWGKTFAESLAYQAYSMYGGGEAGYDGSAYSFTKPLASAMRKFCGPAYAFQDTGPGVTARIIDSLENKKKPIIALTDWDYGGGHFLLIDRIYTVGKTKYCCVCDPYDGYVKPVRLLPGVTTRYRSGYNSGYFLGHSVGFNS